MAIKSNVDFGVVNLSVGDNTVINGSSRGQRYAVSRSSLHNPTVGPINVNIYQSPDFTSASGIFIDSYALAAGDRVSVGGIVGQGYTGLNIIAVPDGAGCNIKCTGIDYTGSDV